MPELVPGIHDFGRAGNAWRPAEPGHGGGKRRVSNRGDDVASTGEQSMAITDEDLHRAEAEMDKLVQAGPVAVEARYDRGRGRVMVRLSTGVDLAFAPHDAQGFGRATAAELDVIEISPSGLGLHFPKLAADLYLPALLEGHFGSKRWTAHRAEAKDAAAE